MSVYYNTKKGVFGPGGHGGGIFQTTIQGLGTLGGPSVYTRVKGLGDVDPFQSVHTSCWDEAGFKNCTETQNKETNKEMFWVLENDPDLIAKPGSAEWNDEFNRRWNQLIMSRCVPNYCWRSQKDSALDSSTTTEIKNLPSGSYNATTKAVQYTLNDFLPKIGKPKIAVDGKLGPNTCQAISDVIQSGLVRGLVMPNACSGKLVAQKTAPVEKAEEYTDSRPDITDLEAAVPFELKTSNSSKGSTTSAVLGFAALLAAGGAFWYYKVR